MLMMSSDEWCCCPRVEDSQVSQRPSHPHHVHPAHPTTTTSASEDAHHHHHNTSSPASTTDGGAAEVLTGSSRVMVVSEGVRDSLLQASHQEAETGGRGGRTGDDVGAGREVIHPGRTTTTTTVLHQHPPRHTLAALSERLAMGRSVKRKLWQVDHDQVRQELAREMGRVEQEETERFRARWREVSPEHCPDAPAFYYTQVVTADGNTVIPSQLHATSTSTAPPAASPPGDIKRIHAEAKRRRIEPPPPVAASTVTPRILQSNPEVPPRQSPPQPKVTTAPARVPETQGGAAAVPSDTHTGTPADTATHRHTTASESPTEGASDSRQDSHVTSDSSTNGFCDGRRSRNNNSSSSSTTTTPNNSRTAAAAAASGSSPGSPSSGVSTPDTAATDRPHNVSTSSKSSSGVSSAESTPSEDVTPSEDMTPSPIQGTRRIPRKSSRARRPHKPEADTSRRHLRM